jgi:hypothetical protein
MKSSAKRPHIEEETSTQQPSHDFEVPYPDEDDANMDIEISNERHLIFKSKIKSPDDLTKFQSSVCDLLKITNPYCGVFGTSTYFHLRLNIMRRLIRQEEGMKSEGDGDTLTIYPAQGIVITFTPENELSYFKIYPLFPSSYSGTSLAGASLVGTKRPR